MDLREIMVPLEKCVGVKVGEIETEVLDELIAHKRTNAVSYYQKIRGITVSGWTMAKSMLPLT